MTSDGAKRFASPTRLTTFAPHSEDVKQSNSFLSRLFGRKTGNGILTVQKVFSLFSALSLKQLSS